MTLSDILAIIGIIVSSFIAYHLFFLNKRLTFKDSMSHGSEVRKIVDGLLMNIRKGGSSKVELINVKRYKKDYPTKNNETRHGYVYIGAELKGYSYDGVEFFNGLDEAYVTDDDKITLKETSKQASFNVYTTGVIPYEWIEFVDPDGDDTSYRPQFFVKFKGKYHLPYKSKRFYRLSEHYNKNNDPLGMKYVSVEVEQG